MKYFPGKMGKDCRHSDSSGVLSIVEGPFTKIVSCLDLGRKEV
jgi:hypothetical protein